MSKKGRSKETESRLVVAWGWRENRKRLQTDLGLLGAHGNVLELERWWLHNSVNVLNATKLYILNG